jgi:hypothetical protein
LGSNGRCLHSERKTDGSRQSRSGKQLAIHDYLSVGVSMRDRWREVRRIWVKGYGAAKKFFSIALIIAGVIAGVGQSTCAGWILDVGRPAQSRIAEHCFRIDTG